MLKLLNFQNLRWYVFLLSMLLISPIKIYAIDNKDGADIDPVAFQFKANKSIVKIGEEFEITVTATLRPTWDFRLGNTELDADFRIKIIFPDGFIQTGGNYSDFVGGKIANKTTASYTVKGKYIRQGNAEEFLLLRGTPQ